MYLVETKTIFIWCYFKLNFTDKLQINICLWLGGFQIQLGSPFYLIRFSCDCNDGYLPSAD